MASWLACQSEGSGFKSRFGVKTRLSTLGTGVVMFFVVLTPRETEGLALTKFGGHKRTTREAGIATILYFGN